MIFLSFLFSLISPFPPYNDLASPSQMTGGGGGGEGETIIKNTHTATWQLSYDCYI